MASKKSSKAYFGLGWIISLILAILPTNVICGIVTRIMRHNWLGLILNIVLAPIFYVIDLVTIILFKDLTILA
jgi:hypothetical protein